MNAGNPIINNIIINSQKNIPMLLPVEMNTEVAAIWKLAGRKKGLVVKASSMGLTELIVYAQGKFYDGILMHSIEQLTNDQQRQLARIITKLQPDERGKFIFTTADFESLNVDLAAILCKIKLTVVISEAAPQENYIGQIG